MVSEVLVKDIAIAARDGYPLAATIYRPALANRVILMNSATAVPRQFYRHFARALAEAGYIAITYDYRGIGGSAPKSLRGFRARARDWALLDMAGVVDWVRTGLEPEKLFMFGHSIGGQVTGLLDNADAIDGMVTVSSQSGHWRLQGGEQKWLVMVHVHFTMPLMARMLGYLPGALIGGVALPRGAALEWAGWCRNRRYVLGDKSLPLERYDRFKAPVLAYSIEGDKWGTQRSVDAMMSAYPNLERRHLDHRQHKLPPMGHVGYFRPASSPLWSEALAWMGQVAERR